MHIGIDKIDFHIDFIQTDSFYARFSAFLLTGGGYGNHDVATSSAELRFKINCTVQLHGPEWLLFAGGAPIAHLLRC